LRGLESEERREPAMFFRGFYLIESFCREEASANKKMLA